MIILISGQPGNGKTLRAMALMLEEYERNQQAVKEGKEQPRRFFSNIKGSTTDENPQAFPWVELLPPGADWTQLSDGAFVIYDEAHSDGQTPGLERYGVLFPSTGRPGESDDPRIRSLATHRHRGFDLVMVTQWPSKLHHNVRQLAGKHIHMNRAMGLQRAGTLTWSRVQPDPYDERQREKAEEEIWAYPEGLYSRYISATLHTSTYKFKVPKRVWIGLARVLMLLAVGWGLWVFMFRPDSAADEVETDPTAGGPAIALAPAGAGVPALQSGERVRVWDTASEYAEDHLPRFATMPWTAPVFDRRETVTDPQLLCMSSGDGIDADGAHRSLSCTCMTEQGTRYEIGEGECRRVARYGTPYNPYKQAQGRGEPSASAALAVPTSAGVPGVVFAGPQVTGYGDLGMRDITTADR